MNQNELDFYEDAQDMWNVKDTGVKHSISINFDRLYKLNIGKLKTKLINKLKNREVDYFIKDDLLFIQESRSMFDWILNFLAFTVKFKVKDEYIRYHAGFYMTAMSVFSHLSDKSIKKIYSYSHGAGATPALALLIYDKAGVLPEVCNFEPPKCILRPKKTIKELCRRFKNYVQGIDTVTKVPWWQSHLGLIVKIKGQKLPWYKKPFRAIFDHDIYWTKS